ncbi:MAG TPA: arsenite S-adenosylmethyltransferase [Candidatus Atribacteria bacterium]|nr:arsenite S-adenosylmethyltransferase [Candidatus Atribacteria bacterium]HCU23226.1 arsenite S-adenosylmethyltransferase [Candidatus Atribacteria bacterium]
MNNEYNQKKNYDIRETIRKAYSEIAKQGNSCCGSSCCGNSPSELVASNLGYNKEELTNLPDGANLGLSCGNPVVIASLKAGEVVLDLGAGGGFDVFISAQKVGPTGRVIGVDMTPDMVYKARHNAQTFKESSGLDNVEFRLGEIEHLPIADESIDVVISNCVINLSPDKTQVWREIARVLKPGGRVSISDLALLKPLPDAVRESVRALVGCIAGAVLVDETREMIRSAGLIIVDCKLQSEYIDLITTCSDPLYLEVSKHLPPGAKLSNYVTSLDILARKP